MKTKMDSEKPYGKTIRPIAFSRRCLKKTNRKISLEVPEIMSVVYVLKSLRFHYHGKTGYHCSDHQLLWPLKKHN